jgi:hypothetical protein
MTALAACSFSGPGGSGPAIDAGDTTPDARPDAGDAGVDGPVELGDWGTPVRVTDLEDLGPLSNYDDPSITDGGELFLAIDGDVYSAQRLRDATSFSAPALVGELSDLALAESTIWVERDGERIMFARAGELLEATRADPGDAWGDPALVTELNTASTEAMGQLTNGGLTLHFISNRAGTFDIYRTTRPTLDDPFVTPPELVAVSGATTTESSVKLTDDELVMYWATKGSAEPTSAFEMVFAERDDVGSPFGPTTPIAELNVAGAVDSDFTPSDDNRRAYFSSDRDNTNLGERIFFVER